MRHFYAQLALYILYYYTGQYNNIKVKLRPAIPNTMYKDSGSPAIQEAIGHRVVDLLEEPLGKDVKAVRFRCIAVNSTSGDMSIHISIVTSIREELGTKN